MAPKTGSVAIDTVPLPENPAIGQIVKARGKYFLQVKGRKMEIPLNPLTTERQVARFAGKEVNVALAATDKRSVVAIGTWPTPERPKWRRQIIICYIPAPDFLRGINQKLQEVMLESLTR